MTEIIEQSLQNCLNVFRQFAGQLYAIWQIWGAQSGRRRLVFIVLAEGEQV
jgi:hypothetical protein